MGIADELVVAIMSYNRGRYLRNCVASVARLMPNVPIWIFDDASDDVETQATLAELAGRHRVFIRPSENIESGYLGGLYGNMNRALDRAIAESIKYLFYIQDDVQIVRACDSYFWIQCQNMFAIPDVVQVQPVFFKGFFSSAYFEEVFSIDEGNGFYDPKVAGFSDIGIVDIAKMSAAGLRMLGSEGETARTIRERGFRMVCHRDPVAMHTPWPETLRRGNWKQKLLQYVNELGTRASCHPFRDMSDRDVKRLINRPIQQFPIAESFLTTTSVLKKPWWYSSSFSPDKILRPAQFVMLRWIFDGTPQYIELCKKLRSKPRA